MLVEVGFVREDLTVGVAVYGEGGGLRGDLLDFGSDAPALEETGGIRGDLKASPDLSVGD